MTNTSSRHGRLHLAPNEGGEDATRLVEDAGRGVDGPVDGPPRLRLEREVDGVEGDRREVTEEDVRLRVEAATRGDKGRSVGAIRGHQWGR